jgi:endonuclease/exonuclease/phosphatase family metal-dependent hydrolase
MLYAHRHLYCSIASQKKSIRQLNAILKKEDPDICCFVEIDKGSSDSTHFNQLEALNEKYPFSDIENKYGQASRLRSLPFSKGKSNAFMAKQKFAYEKIYFTHGTKRLVYKIILDGNTTLFFAHFSLKKKVRVQQLLQIRRLLHETPGDSILLGDFNILGGFQELIPLLHENNLRLLNDEHQPTFTFHRIKKALDLCICSEHIVHRLDLKIIPQPYSDHAALLLEVRKWKRCIMYISSLQRW